MVKESTSTINKQGEYVTATSGFRAENALSQYETGDKILGFILHEGLI